jgi:hypothetical protein
VQAELSAVTALHAAYPDEALAAVLGTEADDPWSPAADEVLARCSALAQAGADGVRCRDGEAVRRCRPASCLPSGSAARPNCSSWSAPH